MFKGPLPINVHIFWLSSYHYDNNMMFLKLVFCCKCILFSESYYYHKINFSLKRLNQAKIVKNSSMSIIKKTYRLKKKHQFSSLYLAQLVNYSAAQKFQNFCSSSPWTCLHHMVILRSQNKITVFLTILAWLSRFNPLIWNFMICCLL